MWKHTWSPTPVKARLSKSVGKVMSIIFCDTKRIVLNHMVPDKTIVIGDYYSGVLWEQLRRTIWDKRPELYRSGLFLHQDNTPVYVSRVVKQTMSDLEPLEHQPYSPDLAICDFFLFPTVKDYLRGRKFESREELGNIFGAKNMNLATTIGERKLAGEIFCLAAERLLRLKIVALCRLIVINVYLNCQLTPQLSTTQFGSWSSQTWTRAASLRRSARTLTAATGNGQNDRP